MMRQVVGWGRHWAEHRPRSQTERDLRSGCGDVAFPEQLPAGAAMDPLLSCPPVSSSDLEGWLGPREQLSPADCAQTVGSSAREARTKLRPVFVCVCVFLDLGGKEFPPPPRPPESPGSFPVTAGSAARAIFNSHSRLCSQQNSLGSQGEGQPADGSKGPGYGALT